MVNFQINSENDEFQIIQSLKSNRVKRSKLGEIFIEGIECIKQAVKSNIEITRIIIKDIDGLSNWGKNILKKYSHVRPHRGRPHRGRFLVWFLMIKSCFTCTQGAVPCVARRKHAGRQNTDRFVNCKFRFIDAVNNENIQTTALNGKFKVVFQ